MTVAVLGSVIAKPLVTAATRHFAHLCVCVCVCGFIFSSTVGFSAVAMMNQRQTLGSFLWACLVLVLVFSVGPCETGALARRISALWRYGKSLKPKVMQFQSRILPPILHQLPYNPEQHMSSVNLASLLLHCSSVPNESITHSCPLIYHIRAVN